MVFLTRNGQKEAEWDLHEQLDAALDKDIDGLGGDYDLFGAIGTFGGIDFEVVFNRQEWLWVPDLPPSY